MSPDLLSKSLCQINRAPRLGEHTKYALKEIIGLTDEEIEEPVSEDVLR
jgi:hypothetical protein